MPNSFSIEEPIITLDCDWAPDFVLEYVYDLLSDSEIKATWFVTNESPFLEKIKKSKIFEVGIHPNFLENSSHGRKPDEILENLKKMVPKAKSVRTHSLVQSSPILDKFKKYGIKNDVSIFWPMSTNLKPNYHKYLKLIRYPYFWEDDLAMLEKRLMDFKLANKIKGLKIYDFHPIHIYLNSSSLKNYENLKKNINLKKIKLNEIDIKIIEPFINKKSNGINIFFKEIISFLSYRKSYTINELSKLMKFEIYKNEVI